MADTLLIRASLEITAPRENLLAEGYVKRGTYVFSVYDDTGADGDTIGADLDALRDLYKTGGVFTARLAGHDYTKGRVVSVISGPTNNNSESEATVVIEERIDEVVSTFLTNVRELASFTESYSFSRSGPNISYTRTVQFSYLPTTTIANFKTIVSGLKPKLDARRKSAQQDGVFPNDLISSEYDAKYTESIDLAKLSYSLTESFSSGRNLSTDYSFVKKKTESTNVKGYTTETINYDITSLRYNRNTVLKAAVKELSAAEISDRTGEQPVSSSRGFSVDGRKASLSMVFSNDPNLASGAQTFYSCEKTKEGERNRYTLSLRVKNTAGATLVQKFNNTVALYKTEATEAKCKGFVSNLFSEATTIFETLRNSTFSKTNNQISATVSFLDEDIFYTGQQAGILLYNTSGSTNNAERKGQEYRLNAGFSLNKKEEFAISNKKDKTSGLTGSISVTFTDNALDTISAFMDGSVIKTDIKSAVESLPSAEGLTLVLRSDKVDIDWSKNTASRSISFDGFDNSQL